MILEHNDIGFQNALVQHKYIFVDKPIKWTHLAEFTHNTEIYPSMGCWVCLRVT